MFDVDSLLRWGKVLLANSSCHIQRERLMTTWESLSHTSQQSHVRTQNFMTRDGSRGGSWHVWRCDAPSWPIWHRLSLSGLWQLSAPCTLHSPHCLVSANTRLLSQLSASNSKYWHRGHVTRQLSLWFPEMSDWWIFGIFMSSSSKLSLRSGLKHKQTRIAYQTDIRSQKSVALKDWLNMNISGIFITCLEPARRDVRPGLFYDSQSNVNVIWT